MRNGLLSRNGALVANALKLGAIPTVEQRAWNAQQLQGNLGGVPDLWLSLEQLENDVWPEPGPNASYLVRRCTELRRKPLNDFEVEDLRIMLGQQIGVPHLLPVALSVLEKEPLSAGHSFPGDLLSAVLSLDWQTQRHDLRERLSTIVERVEDGVPVVAEAVERFRRNYGHLGGRPVETVRSPTGLRPPSGPAPR